MTRKSIVFYVLLTLCTIFSAHTNESCSGNKQCVKNSIHTEESLCPEYGKSHKKKIVPVKDMKLDFYISINSGKIYSDNSKPFVNGIKAIGERVFTLVERRYDAIIKNIVADEIESVKKFDGEINFQWLNSISLGYYAGRNGQVDFEVIYSKFNIKNGNSTTMLDSSAGIFAFLLNIYYTPSIQCVKIAPYISLGIGPEIFRLRKVNGSSQNLMPLNIPWFAYQVKLGFDYSITSEVKSFFGYRYFSTPIPIADDISTHSIGVGLAFNF
ncbi:P44/Msp2 family outer membrane protein [Wolbachia endosymbiont of Cruorifilaria tuberocauda]|uniref:P44/Msp2 family outer membrane protein n=1 Tax=Wolbachia endosymbiont of Cruorifilaria tuberocauda TaxID=1812111 RepID=UPI00158D92B8|nr:P44/Msp2 family outer membrane protein [Wolbachia endosymbiont of Cruorifilaria tuberocauda]QKX01486.1 P44/Msp2 family outer membrane protein [Wolbachia endosymbiont of Cruorifilaria tuberocauda]